MSWNAYVDSLKMPDEKGIVAVEEAALCGILPGKEGVWASSEGLASITEDEIKKLAGDRKDFGQCGPCIAGVKCRMIRDSMDDETLHSLDLKTASDNEGNTYNICVGKSESVLIIAKGTKEANGGQISSKVTTIVKYLRDKKM